MPEKISIIIPLYNRVDLISETLYSIQTQTYPNWEAIVVDDGSTDGSFEIVGNLTKQDRRIRLLRRNREPKGAPTCRNIGTDLSQGDYLIFLDSDDLLASHCLEQRIQSILQDSSYDFWVFSMLMFYHKPGDSNILWNISTEEDDLARFLRTDAVWQTTCPIHRRTSFLKYGMFKEGLPYWQDYELHVRMLSQGVRYKKQMDRPPDCFYRQHDKPTISQKSSRNADRSYVMSRTYRELTDSIIHEKTVESEREKAIQSMYFRLSINQASAQNIMASLSSWRYAYEKGLESSYRFTVGYSCLWIKYLKVCFPQGALLFDLLYKVLVRLLPKRYRQMKSTLQQIPYTLPTSN